MPKSHQIVVMGEFSSSVTLWPCQMGLQHMNHNRGIFIHDSRPWMYI